MLVPPRRPPVGEINTKWGIIVLGKIYRFLSSKNIENLFIKQNYSSVEFCKNSNLLQGFDYDLNSNYIFIYENEKQKAVRKIEWTIPYKNLYNNSNYDKLMLFRRNPKGGKYKLMLSGISKENLSCYCVVN